VLPRAPEAVPAETITTSVFMTLAWACLRVMFPRSEGPGRPAVVPDRNSSVKARAVVLVCMPVPARMSDQRDHGQ